MKKTIALMLTLLLCLPAIAFANGPKLTLQVGKLTIYQDNVYTLSYTLEPNTGARVYWTSSDPAIVQVDDQGVITGLAKGSAKVTAYTEDGAAKATCKVTVKKPNITPISATMEGNVYDSNYNPVGSSTEAALRSYCERLGKSRGEKIARWAVEKLGTSYDTMDCSQLAQAAYKANGIRISRTSGKQAADMAKYERTDGQPRVGDLIFLSFPSGRPCSCGEVCRRYRKVHHTAIYLGNVDGTNYVVDSSSYFGNVIIRGYSGTTVAGMDIVFVAGK